MSKCSLPSTGKYLAGFYVFDRYGIASRWVPELSEVIDSEPPRAPHQIEHAVVCSISVQIDGGIKLGVERRQESVCDENGDRPLVEEPIPSHPYDLNSRRVEGRSDQTIITIASYSSFTTD